MKEFLDGLDIKMRQKMLRSIQALQDMGISLRMPLSESLEDGIFELRAKSGTNISRVMYFFIIGNRAVLTHGFIKKTQKTPRRELQRAKDIRADYFRRFGR
ncbi:type II toxin-antitoxin system RelE/ParE family toxin [uncultured Dialister sp.]|uniref:type II toxin-antitoxin system RelE/ParE family toxin n=1 Tax=uncultured Dialister sp. TaxID=278064 RepID=UPI0025DA30A5|nr:type II toxin-antitoxin system RelE/ParE family toxin [uncultured Dialister sp.]